MFSTWPSSKCFSSLKPLNVICTIKYNNVILPRQKENALRLIYNCILLKNGLINTHVYIYIYILCIDKHTLSTYQNKNLCKHVLAVSMSVLFVIMLQHTLTLHESISHCCSRVVLGVAAPTTHTHTHTRTHSSPLSAPVIRSQTWIYSFFWRSGIGILDINFIGAVQTVQEVHKTTLTHTNLHLHTAGIWPRQIKFGVARVHSNIVCARQADKEQREFSLYSFLVHSIYQNCWTCGFTKPKTQDSWFTVVLKAKKILVFVKCKFKKSTHPTFKSTMIVFKS